jgi:hypothetical protein
MSTANPANEAARQQMYRRMAAVPADVREFIGETYGQTQITVQPLPYWSTIRFQGEVAAGPPVTVTIDTSERVAFAYAVGQQMTIAGFPAGFPVAGKADTNLKKQGETRNNEDVWIWGLAATIQPNSEPALAAALWRNVALDMAIGGDNTIPIGTLEMYPGAGGLAGGGRSFLKSPATNVAGAADGGVGGAIDFTNNGWPMAGNFRRFPQPFKWAKVGAGGSDSSLNIIATPQRAIVEAGGLAVVGPPAFTPPAATGDPGTFVDVRFQLICVSVRFRSVNQ